MAGARKEPDWKKFGLDNERQPLNPGGPTSAATAEGGGTASTGNRDLYGGQPQNESELFADDQVR